MPGKVGINGEQFKVKNKATIPQKKNMDFTLHTSP